MKKLIDITFLVDRSGSMASIKADMEGGYKTFIQEQIEKNENCCVTIVQFDDQYCPGVQEVYLNEGDYPKLEIKPRGSTALNDSIGKVIADTTERIKDDRIVLIVIITDGQENASKTYSLEAVKQLIEAKKALGWDFVFLGANLDVKSEASSRGIDVNSTINLDNGIHKGWADMNLSYTSYSVAKRAHLSATFDTKQS